jgi:hypothetical protein
LLAALLVGGAAELLIVSSAAALPAAGSAMWRRILRLAAITACCAVPLALGWSVRRWYDETCDRLRSNTLYIAARWVTAHLPEDAVIGSWNAGTISYLSGRRVVNLDGLVNSWGYYQSERYDLCRYWQTAGVTHLVDMFNQKQAPSLIPLFPAYQRCSDRFELIWSDDVDYSSWRMMAYRLNLDRSER